VVVSTQVIKRTSGKMMWQREYVDFATSTAGGKMSDEESAAQWATWISMKEKDPSDPNLSWDMEGPPKSPLQFRVVVGKFVDFANVYAHEKVVECSEKLKKDISEEELSKYRMKAMSGHENIAASGASSVDFAEIGRDMARESSAHATGTFGADMQRLTGGGHSLKDLLPDLDEDLDDNEGDGNPDDTEVGGEDGKGGGHPGKKDTDCSVHLQADRAFRRNRPKFERQTPKRIVNSHLEHGSSLSAGFGVRSGSGVRESKR
jgi:hypothetical protein